MKPYYSLTQEGREADVIIYGDIISWPLLESDVSAYLLSERINGIEADIINVHINSYGGEVAEGLAIYNALKRHKAKVSTYCDGFACSAAAVVFMAGEDRVMGEASLLMAHNAWLTATGNAEMLRKAADDLETISQTAANVFRAEVNVSDEELEKILAEETWISPEDAVRMGFATRIETYGRSAIPAASARELVMQKLTASHAAAETMPVRPVHTEEAPPPQNKPMEFLNALTRGKGKTDEK